MKTPIFTALIALSFLAPASLALADDDKEKKVFEAVIEDSKGRKTTLKEAMIKGAEGLFSAAEGKTEIEVKKGGGPLKIKIPFDKIKSIEITAIDPNKVELKITSITNATLVATIPPNIQIVGQTDFGEAKIKIREAKIIKLRQTSGPKGKSDD